MTKLFPYTAIATLSVAVFVASAPSHAAETVVPVAAPSAATYAPATVSSDRLSGLSRAEVLADLQIWKASGLAEQQHGYTSTISDAAYQRALARYTALRNSPNFSILVQSLAAN